GLEPLLLEAGEEEGVDRVANRRRDRAGDLWDARATDGLEGPVLLILRPLLDPALDRLPLGVRERLVRLGRGHHEILVAAGDARPHLALGQVAGDNCGSLL